MQSAQAERIERAWAAHAGVPRLSPHQVVVRPRSRLSREGWIGVLSLGDTLTWAVPRPDLVPRIESALPDGLTRALTADDIVAWLEPVEVLGPASLFYPPGPLVRPAPVASVSRASPAELEEFRRTLPDSDLEESGLPDVEADAFAARDGDARLLAVCGYRRWPANIAHLCVATGPSDRRRGAARRAARAAIADAIDHDLLPQWRARPEASKALARSLGLEQWGFQMSVRL
jgi:RimJ/RimL family protein N-acetyltransferase